MTFSDLLVSASQQMSWFAPRTSVLFAERTTTIADGASRTVFEWGRIQSNTDWIVPVGASVVIALFVRAMVRRDAVELGPGIGWLLTGLRCVAFLGLLVLYLGPQWRSEREVTRNSRVLVLVDTSSSMGLIDAEASVPPGATNRAGQVAAVLGESGFLKTLRRVHDVVVLRFDEKTARIVSLDKFADAVRGSPDPALAARSGDLRRGTTNIDWVKSLAPTGTETRLGEALRQLVHEQRDSPVSGIVVFSDGRQNAGVSVDAAVEAAREAGISIFPVGVGADQQPSNVRVYKLEALPRAYPGDPYTVTALIQAQGPTSAFVVPPSGARRGSPPEGGTTNDGSPPEGGTTNGGSPPEGGTTNNGLAGKSVTVQLLRRGADDRDALPGSGTLIDSQNVILGGAGETVPVKFELTADETGRQTFCVRLLAPRADHNPSDDYREVDVEVVDRKDRVLLFAGGPTREYRFLRAQLFREASMTVDVLLQTARPGISQEADAILDDFPATREEMFAYDCVVAIDPDWQTLGRGQIELLEQWVAEQGGGMIAVAGAVYTGEAVTGWVRDPAMEKIRALYPVVFRRRASVLESATHAGPEPWPLDLTREGLAAEHLWLADSGTSSLQAWAAFSGVYGYYPVRGPKAAATVLARFSDPRTRQGDEQPVYIAEQFYGSGRVLYLGSGEMWRLRRVDESYFERLYTGLIRHVSQGRLLRQSSRGVLMVGKDRYTLGQTVEVRARLTDAQLAPLDVAQVELEVFEPDGRARRVVLRPEPGRLGTYAGQITVLREGAYRLELPVPESGRERISRRIHVALPDLERQNPQRNDALLARIAEGSGGHYYESVEAALGAGGGDPLVEHLKDRTKTVILTAAPDPAWEETWLRWLMGAVCGVLCLEWLIRRLCKLA